MNGVSRSCLALLSLGLVAALAAASDERPKEIRGKRMKVDACCDSLPSDERFWEGVVTPREITEGTPIPAAALERLKEEALVSPDAPPGREAGDAEDAESPPDTKAAPVAPAASVDLVRSFDGLDRRTAGHEGVMVFPPDTIVAASRKKVLEASNIGLRLSNLRGERAEIKSLNNFFGEAYPPLVFDPKVYFDRLSDRFVVTALSVTEDPNRSTIYFAISRSGNPGSLSAPQDWCSYRINGKRKRAWADYPGLGANERWFAISVNNFRFAGGFRSVFVYAIEKDRLVSGSASGRCPQLTVHRFQTRTDAAGSVAFTVQPAQHYSESGLEGDPLFFVSTRFGTNDRYVLWRLRDTGAAKPVMTRTNLKGDGDYTVPPLAEQRQGLPLDTGDTRVMQSAFRDGKIWATHATGCNLGSRPNESCVRVVAIEPDETGGAVTYEDTFGTKNWFYWNPGIAVNQRGDVVVAFQRSRPASFMSTGFTSKAADEAVFGRVEGLVKGGCPLDNFSSGIGANRSGDYVGAQTDPRDSIGFWIAGEYPGEVEGLGCDWRTRVGLVR